MVEILYQGDLYQVDYELEGNYYPGSWDQCAEYPEVVIQDNPYIQDEDTEEFRQLTDSEFTRELDAALCEAISNSEEYEERVDSEEYRTRASFASVGRN